ncbi:hypothetical protein FE391_34680, partial [Nonomuraea sp. KC401]|uniref:C39 family peptidase n=2 Tax=unclassified Nonomuraea TaxID=2593643 RepID=UPI0012814BA9
TTPPPSATPTSSPTAGTKGLLSPLKYKLSLTGQRQQNGYYCVPASSSMSLSTFGIKVSQATLAKKMKTAAPGGTTGNAVTPVLNAYVKSKGFRFTVPKSGDGNALVLMDRISTNVGDYHKAPLLGVWMEQLPWNKGKVNGTKVAHAIIAYGYDKLAGTITVYDPGRSTGGSHTVSASTLAKTLQPGWNMYFIEKL